MSAKSNPFSSFADRAIVEEKKKEEVEVATSEDGPFTVAELIAVLQGIIDKNPALADAPVFCVEFGAMKEAITVILKDDERVIID